MKNTGKKALSVLLALLLLASLLPMAALAVVPTTYAEVYTENELKNALNDGVTITLGDDINVNEALTVSKDTTLDLNGHTLAVNHNGMENYAVLVNAYLTVQDTSDGKNGKITSNGVSTIYMGYGEDTDKNSLTLKSGTLENTGDDGNVIVALGWNISTVNIAGGTVRSAPVEGARQGYSIFAQAEVHITGGDFFGILNFSDEGRTDRQTVTGGSFDKPFGMNYPYGSGNRIDFYGTRYKAVKDNNDLYKVQQAFDVGFTIRYEFPKNEGLSKRDDVFEGNTQVADPEAPDCRGYVFVGWYTNEEMTTKAEFPITVTNDMTLYGKYKQEPEPEPKPEYADFFNENNPLKNLVVGGTVMVEDGVIKTSSIEMATLSYSEDHDVYTLTLDTYVSNESYTWSNAYASMSYCCGIYAEGDLAILLKGENKITVNNGSVTGAIGIAENNGCLAIIGKENAKLTLNAAAGGTVSYPTGVGIYVDGMEADRTNLLIKDCQVDVTATSAGEKSYLSAGAMVGANSMQVLSDVIVDGAKVTLTSKAGKDGAATGMAVFGDLTIVDKSTVKIKIESADSSSGSAFLVSGIECEDGELDVFNSSLSFASDCKAAATIGISADDIYFSDATASIAAPAAELYSFGVKASGSVEIYGGTLTASGGKTDTSDSCGIKAESFYVWNGEVTATASSSTSGNSVGIGTSAWFEVEGGGEVTARADQAGQYSNGVYAVGSFYIEAENSNDEDSWVDAYGGIAGEYSYGVCVEGLVVIDGGRLLAGGGEAGRGSRGVYVEPADDDDLFIDGCLAVINDGYVYAKGGDAGSNSYGVKLEGGWLYLGPLTVDGEDKSSMDACGGNGVESYGVYVCTYEEEDPAIRLYGGAKLNARGGVAKGVGKDESNGQSYGVWTDGSIEVKGGMLDAYTSEGSDNTIGICLYGENLSFTLTEEAKVSTMAFDAEAESAGVIFARESGIISLDEDCSLQASAGAALISVGIMNVKTLGSKGQLVAAAEKAEHSYGLLMASEDPIVIEKGILGAIGQTAAIYAVSHDVDTPVTVKAPAIEYSREYDGILNETAAVKDGYATLVSDGTQKQILATASGTIGSLRVMSVNTALTYGEPVSFTATVEPSSMVMIVEERWTRSDGALVISSLDASPAAPTAGTYSYTLVLAPISEKFKFNEINVVVNYAGDDNKGIDTKPKNGQLIVSDSEDFVEDVTVTAPYVPSYVGGTTTYTPTITDSAHGKVTADPKAAAAGDTVKLTATPDAGYELDTLTVKDANGKDVELTKNTDGTYSYVQPAGKVTVTATFKESKAEAVRPFTDVKQGDWFYNAVYHCFDKGYFKGVSETKFDPQGTMTRAMFATVLYRMASEPTVTGENKFADVKGGQWYTDAILWATQAGIVDGYGDGNFGVDDPITREQMVTMLYRYAQSKGQGFQGLWSIKLDFPDASDVSDWALEAMSWMVMNGVIKGKDGKLAPGATATRAEVAQLIMNFDGLAG